MFTTDYTLRQQFAETRFRDFLREAERERRVALALAARPARRSVTIDSARAKAASALLRAGHRLMPEDARDRSASADAPALEFSPGR